MIERTFAWACINRRLARDVERFAATVQALFQIAMIKLMSRRIARYRDFKSNSYTRRAHGRADAAALDRAGQRLRRNDAKLKAPRSAPNPQIQQPLFCAKNALFRRFSRPDMQKNAPVPLKNRKVR